MNKENAHLFLPIVQALVDGKQIQYKQGCKDNQYWVDFEEDDQIGFHDDPEDYRIKPEPRRWDVWLHWAGKVINSDPDKWYGPNEWERITVQEVLE